MSSKITFQICAQIYTLSEDGNDLGIYSYAITSKTKPGVQREDEQHWNSTVNEDDGQIKISMQIDLDKSPFTRETEVVTIRAAWHTDYEMNYHGSNGRSEGKLDLDLTSGESKFEKDDETLEIAHGAIMWAAWAVFASIGIFTAAFKWLLPEQSPLWFQIHRAFQVFTVLLTVAGFVIAVVMMDKKDDEHFVGSHPVIGLVVTIFACLQPINALFRPPAAVKDTKRLIWERIHITFGYGTWILACVNCYLGLEYFGEKLLAQLHLFLWCGLMLVVYIVLLMWPKLCGGDEKQSRKESVPQVEIMDREDSSSPKDTDRMMGGNKETALISS